MCTCHGGLLSSCGTRGFRQHFHCIARQWWGVPSYACWVSLSATILDHDDTRCTSLYGITVSMPWSSVLSLHFGKRGLIYVFRGWSLKGGKGDRRGRKTEKGLHLSCKESAWCEV